MDYKFQFDLTLMPKELKLLLELIKDENDQHIQQQKKEWFANIDWDYFLKLSMHHRIYPLVYLKLKEVASELTPSYVLQTLQVEYQKNTFQMLHLSGEMERISKLFTENQIRSLFLKGPAVAHGLYGDISLRTSKDIDVLVQKSDLEKAEELLLKHGYKNTQENITLNEKKGRNYHITYFNPRKKVEIELHWRLHPFPITQPTFNQLWERKRNSNFTRYPVLILGSEDLFLYLSVHGARHGWFRLRWLKDIDQMLKQQLNSQQVNFLQKKYRYSHMIGQALTLVNQLLSVEVNREMKLLSKRNSKNLAHTAIFYIRRRTHSHINESENLNNYHTRYLFLLMSPSRKILFILTLLYPSSKDQQVISLPNSLHFLYFPLRPFLWIWRKTVKLIKL
ncbi:nucleotidyltransferase domain-containing protein [Priestia megaterium]|uniref:nucleotidyltransferase domain-containing protein n=1 Tax=Priestia megaterium TaxID=1404 RepID=UPI00207A9708|nr:nucleotidyltransferase family protein [Priestia megaterium]USL31713.1 nucleotidyltransferase family protein [Priestia megaterium]